MNTARPFLAWALVVCFVLAGAVSGSIAGMASRSELGKPLDGLSMDERKLFRDSKEKFGEVQDAASGLGPIFNNTSCVACHSAPAIGGSSPLNETRAQRVDGLGAHFDFPGGSLFQSDAISPSCQEVVPPNAVVAMRQTTPLYGLGVVEAIPDGQIEDYAAQQARSFPQQAGRVNQVLDVASGRLHVGRFGWKTQQATLLAFSGDAYINEMGITSQLFPTESAPNGDVGKLAACDKVADPEDDDDDVTAFANFMRLLAPPPGAEGCGRADHHHRSSSGLRSIFSRSDRGERLFEKLGCAVCHHAGFTASSPIAAIDGETVDAYSDFLLHDVGTGDGIVQGGAEANELRTAPLWGLSQSAPYLHDGSAPTIQDAIRRHANQGAASQQAFRALPLSDQQAVLAFLNSL